jgi:hypothetical protein
MRQCLAGSKKKRGKTQKNRYSRPQSPQHMLDVVVLSLVATNWHRSPHAELC